MDREEIIEGVIALLRQHEDHIRGSVHQEPYKGDFFKLFSVAFNAGLMASPQPIGYLSADALTDVVISRAPEIADGKTLRELHTFWHEWTYAWKRSNELQRNDE